MYHKIFPTSPTEWWITVDQFHRQMWELQSRNVVYLDDYDSSKPNQVSITFDGVYSNVLTYAAPILSKFGYPFELFVVENFIGRENIFDIGEPAAAFATYDELKELELHGGRLQWHTKTHPDLASGLAPDQIATELSVPPEFCRGRPNSFKWVAYPHGRFTAEVEGVAKKLFRGAVSCNQGDETNSHRLNRLSVTNETTFKRGRVACIIASYNYGAFLTEAIESVLRQTILPDEILITDDCSSDNTQEIGEEFARLHPTLVRYNRNERNLGIVENFNQSVALTTSDYVFILGADNRVLSNYIEKCAAIFETDSTVGVVYTDFYFFGPRARMMFDGYAPEWKGKVVDDQLFQIVVPGDRIRNARMLNARNFIHGSSMFRRSVFDKVGGYMEKSNRPEDYDLFYRILNSGFSAAKCKETALQYRQHSVDQANIRYMGYATLLHYMEKSRRLEAELHLVESSLWRRVFYPATAFRRNAAKLSKVLRTEGMMGLIRRVRARLFRPPTSTVR
jgi:glycosyltransferase involved in cell wall biosynthesis